MGIRKRVAAGEPSMLEFADPDIASITRYLAGELSPSDTAAFDDRLADDAALFDKALPLMALHVAPIDFAALEQRAAAAEREAAAESGSSTPSPRTQRPASRVPRPASRMWWGLAKWTSGGIAAAATLIAIGVGFDPDVQQVTANDARSAGSAGSAVATSYDTKDVVLANAALVSLHPNGFVGYPSGPAPDGTLERVVHWMARQKFLILYLTGSATFQMPPDAGLTEVVTSVGAVTLEPDGLYEVTSDKAADRMTVRVRKGRATLVSGDSSAPIVTVTTGGSATLHGAPDAASSDVTVHQSYSLPSPAPYKTLYPGAPR